MRACLSACRACVRACVHPRIALFSFEPRCVFENVRYTRKRAELTRGKRNRRGGNRRRRRREKGNLFLSDIYHASLRALADASACVSATRGRREQKERRKITPSSSLMNVDLVEFSSCPVRISMVRNLSRRRRKIARNEARSRHSSPANFTARRRELC